MTLQIDILTLFPAMLDGPLAGSIPARIQEQGLASIRVHDLREWGLGRHRSVDDTPYGGGAGMILRPEPVADALDTLRRPDSTAILLDPVGEVFRQDRAADLAGRSHLIFLCPRYEGVDERIRTLVDLELSIGDYVLTGGELPALVVIDAVIRLLPGAIEEGFGLLEIPVEAVAPNPRQPRTTFEDDALEALAMSIREVGVLQPIVVRKAGNGFELIAGERRLRAAKLAGLATVPAVVRESDDAESLR